MSTTLFKLRNMYFSIVLGFLVTVFVLPVQAQTKVRDHRTKTSSPSKEKVKAQTANNAEVMAPADNNKDQILYFDEADALFGKRTALMERPASFEYTGKMDTIHIKQKLHEGVNSVYQMKSGNTLHASVKNGRIVELILKDPDKNEIRARNQNDYPVVNSKEKPAIECLNCKEICVDEIDEIGGTTGGIVCWTQCTKVDCDSKDNNAILLPDKNKK